MGSGEAAATLGAVLLERGELREAQQVLEEGVRLGSKRSAHNLAVVSSLQRQLTGLADTEAARYVGLISGVLDDLRKLQKPKGEPSAHDPTA